MIALVVHGIFTTRENKTSWLVAPRSRLSQRTSEISTRVLWFEPIGGLHPQRCAHAERKKKRLRVAASFGRYGTDELDHG